MSVMCHFSTVFVDWISISDSLELFYLSFLKINHNVFSLTILFMYQFHKIFYSTFNNILDVQNLNYYAFKKFFFYCLYKIKINKNLYIIPTKVFLKQKIKHNPKWAYIHILTSSPMEAQKQKQSTLKKLIYTPNYSLSKLFLSESSSETSVVSLMSFFFENVFTFF